MEAHRRLRVCVALAAFAGLKRLDASGPQRQHHRNYPTVQGRIEYLLNHLLNQLLDRLRSDSMFEPRFQTAGKIAGGASPSEQPGPRGGACPVARLRRTGYGQSAVRLVEQADARLHRQVDIRYGAWARNTLAPWWVCLLVLPMGGLVRRPHGNGRRACTGVLPLAQRLNDQGYALLYAPLAVHLPDALGHHVEHVRVA